MLTTEPTLIRRAFNLLFVCAVVGAAGTYVFRTEMAEAISDKFVVNDNAVKRKWIEGTRGVVTLRPERNDPQFLQVSGLRAGTPTAAGVAISFDLTNLGDSNDFPNIAVVMVGAAGRPLRQILFTPKEYSHARLFEQERVELLIRPESNERRFTVTAFYGARP